MRYMCVHSENQPRSCGSDWRISFWIWGKVRAHFIRMWFENIFFAITVSRRNKTREKLLLCKLTHRKLTILLISQSFGFCGQVDSAGSSSPPKMPMRICCELACGRSFDCWMISFKIRQSSTMAMCSRIDKFALDGKANATRMTSWT